MRTFALASLVALACSSSAWLACSSDNPTVQEPGPAPDSGTPTTDSGSDTGSSISWTPSVACTDSIEPQTFTDYGSLSAPGHCAITTGKLPNPALPSPIAMVLNRDSRVAHQTMLTNGYEGGGRIGSDDEHDEDHPGSQVPRRAHDRAKLPELPHLTG